MTENKKYFGKNIVYCLQIDNVFYYIGSHSHMKKNYYTEAQILQGSGNYLYVEKCKGIISIEEYNSRVKLLWVKSYSLKEEACEAETCYIQEYKEKYGDLLKNSNSKKLVEALFRNPISDSKRVSSFIRSSRISP